MSSSTSSPLSPRQTGFETARYNMVVSQLNTNGIVSEPVLAAFHGLPREHFVPADRQGVCYLDEDITLSGGRFLVEPLILARMVELAALNKNDSVLTFGDPTGYAAAILSQLAGKVVHLDNNETQTRSAEIRLQELGVQNVTCATGSLKAGHAAGAPYNHIIISGAVSALPQNLLSQLAEGGKIFCVLQPHARQPGKIAILERSDAYESNQGAHRFAYDATTRYIPEYEPQNGFSL